MFLALARLEKHRAAAAVVVVLIRLSRDEHSLRIYCALEQMKQVSTAREATRQQLLQCCFSFEVSERHAAAVVSFAEEFIPVER